MSNELQLSKEVSNFHQKLCQGNLNYQNLDCLSNKRECNKKMTYLLPGTKHKERATSNDIIAEDGR